MSLQIILWFIMNVQNVFIRPASNNEEILFLKNYHHTEYVLILVCYPEKLLTWVKGVLSYHKRILVCLELEHLRNNVLLTPYTKHSYSPEMCVYPSVQFC